MNMISPSPDPSLAFVDPAYKRDRVSAVGLIKAPGFSRTTDPAPQITSRPQFLNPPNPSLPLLDPAYVADCAQIA